MDLLRPHHLAPKLESARVLLVCRDFSGTGVSHVGLGISASYTAKTLGEHGVWAESLATKSAEALRQKLHELVTQAVAHGNVRPSHVIIAAPWIAVEDIASLAREFPSINFVVTSHSSIGFLAADPHAIKIMRGIVDLQMATHNVFASGNAIKFTNWVSESWGVPALWLPNLYPLTEILHHHQRPLWNGQILRLGLFGANRPLKNHISGAAAAVELAARLRCPIELHISSGRDEGGGTAAIKEITDGVPGLTVKFTGWLPWPQFRNYLRGIDLVFQLSYTESFNVVSADAIAEGVPVVASPAIDWVPRSWQAESDNPGDIARVAESLLRDQHAIRHGRQSLTEYVEKGVAQWKKVLLH